MKLQFDHLPSFEEVQDKVWPDRHPALVPVLAVVAY